MSSLPSDQFSQISSLGFIPRPLILKALAQLSKSESDLDPGHLLTLAAVVQPSSLPNHVLRRIREMTCPEFGKSCTDPETNFHDLYCGHTVLAAPYWPSVNVAKEPCGLTCARNSAVKPTQITDTGSSDPESAMPFICPQCIEDGLRAEFDRCIAEAVRDGTPMVLVPYSAPNNPQKDIEIWTKAYVKDMIELYGMRPAQGLTGVFRMEKHEWRKQTARSTPNSVGGEKKEDPITRAGIQTRGRDPGRKDDLVLKRGTGVRRREQAWTCRDSRSPRSRSRSPDTMERDDDDSDEDVKWKKSREKYRQRPSISRTRCTMYVKADVEVDRLTERLSDIKVGIAPGDSFMESLLADMGGMGIAARESSGEE